MESFSKDRKQVTFVCNICSKSIAFEADFWGNYSDLVKAGWCGQQYKDNGGKYISIHFCGDNCYAIKTQIDEAIEQYELYPDRYQDYEYLIVPPIEIPKIIKYDDKIWKFLGVDFKNRPEYSHNGKTDTIFPPGYEIVKNGQVLENKFRGKVEVLKYEES